MRSPSGVASDPDPVKQKLAVITYDTTPERYRHWTLAIDPPIAVLTLRPVAESCDDVADGGGDDDDDDFGPLMCSLLSVDIELSDALQRLRFEYPEVGAVVVTGGTDQAFCTGIVGVPPGSAPHVEANVWAFRNELRCAIEDASANSGQYWLTALNGPGSGPGYELALATDEIVLIDDSRSAVALPEVAELGVLPPSGALARLVDKRRVRPDRIDAFCCCAAGIAGDQALEWGLVDRIAPEAGFAAVVGERARARAGSTLRGRAGEAVELGPLRREEFDGGFAYPNVRVELDEEVGEARLTIVGPPDHECFAPEPGPRRLRSRWWPLAVCRELDDALLLLRSNSPGIHSILLRTEGDPLAVASADVALTSGYDRDWFVREVTHYWKRTLRRIDLTWQSVIALVEPGSCFVGTLLEVGLAADRIYMLDPRVSGDPPVPGDSGVPPARLFLTGMNFGLLPQASGLSRLESRFLGRDDRIAALAERVGDPIPPAEAAALGLVTEVISGGDWEARVRQAVKERAGLPLATRARLTSALNTAAPETLETKIFSRGVQRFGA
jgi:benzoyl-CoA-dihydrodiol lyase